MLRSIEQALERSRYFVLVISPEYVSNQWANFEMGVALSRDATSDTERIIPIYVRSVDRSALPPRIANIHAVDASGQSAEQIASDLASIVVGDKRKQKS